MNWKQPLCRDSLCGPTMTVFFTVLWLSYMYSMCTCDCLLSLTLFVPSSLSSSSFFPSFLSASHPPSPPYSSILLHFLFSFITQFLSYSSFLSSLPPLSHFCLFLLPSLSSSLLLPSPSSSFTVCPEGEYQARLSATHQCQSCPSHSSADELGTAVCVCDDNFFRLPTEPDSGCVRKFMYYSVPNHTCNVSMRQSKCGIQQHSPWHLYSLIVLAQEKGLCE